MQIHILRVIIVCALLEASYVHGSHGNTEVKSVPDPRRPQRPSSLNGDGIKGIADANKLRSPFQPEKQVPSFVPAAHLRGARSTVGRVAEDDRQLRADNIFRSVVECDTFCNKPRRACGNRCRARITSCEAQGVECHPWLCRAFCRGDRSNRYCQNRQIPSDECNRYRKGCSCRNYGGGGSTETYDPVSGLTAFFDYSTNEVVVRWDKVNGPKLYDVRISKDNTRVKRLIARGSTKKIEAALFDLDATYDVAVRRKRGKMMGSSPYVSVLYKHVIDENLMHRAKDDQVSTTEDHVGDPTGNILDNDVDPDFGHTLTVDLHQVAGPAGSRATYSGDGLSMMIELTNGSTLSLSTNGDFIFHRAPGAYQELSGTQDEYEEFKYVVGDNHGNSAEATLYIRIDGANDAPIALSDLFIHSSNDPTTIEDVSDGCVLDNDHDIDIGDVANLAVCVVNGVEIQNDIHQHVDLGQHTKLSIGADGCFTISGLATEYQYLPKGETADMCFFYQACDGFGYKSNVAEACVRVEGIYEGGQDNCLADNGGCDPLTECINSSGGPTCGPCPPGYSGTGESGCMQNTLCNSFHFSVENDAEYTTLLFEGWTNAQVSWEISLSSKATKFDFNLPAMDGTEISSLETGVGILESTIADVNNTLTLPDIRVAPSSTCSREDATLTVTIPSSVSNICFGDGCRTTLCRLPPLPSTLPHYTFVPSNNKKLFGDSHNCTILRPSFWGEWVQFHFGFGEEYLSDDFYYADPDNDGVMNIIEYYGMGEAQFFSDTIDPADDEVDFCQQEGYNDVVFLGIQSATSYHAGVVELEWFPAFYNSTGEIAEGVSYEIFVSHGDYDFGNLNGSLVCPPNITDLHRSFESGTDGKFYLSTNQTNVVIEGQPLGELLSIQVVAVADESSIRERGLFVAALMPSFPVYTPTGFGIVVSPRDPIYAPTYTDMETTGRYKGPFYPSGECGGYHTDTDVGIEETLSINYYRVFAPGDVLVFSRIKGANDAEFATWTLIESIKVGDISSGILSGGGGLFQVEIDEYFPEACEYLQFSTEGTCIALVVTPIDIESIYDDLFYSKIDDVYGSTCITTGSYARRELGLQLYKEFKVEKISSTKKYLNDLLTLRLTQSHHLYFGVEIDFKKSTGFQKATAAVEFSFNAESSVAFGPDLAVKKKTPEDLEPFWELKKPIYKFFFINGYIPMWFHVTPRVDIEGEFDASAQFNMKAGLNLYFGKKLFIEYTKDSPKTWNAGVVDAKSQKEKEDEKLTFEAPEFKYDAALSASTEIKLVVPIEFYKVLKATPLEVAVSLGLKVTLDAEVEGTTEEALSSANRPVKLMKFDSKVALLGYLDGKVGNGVLDWKYTTKDEDGEDMDGKELLALKSELQKALLHQDKCRWGGSSARCDAVIPIRATSPVVDEKLSFPNVLSMDDSSEWYFDPETGSSGWELSILTTPNEYNLDPHVSAVLRKKDACKVGQVELPSGSIFFLSKPSFPSLPASIPLFTVAEEELAGGVCSDYESTMNLPLAGTDPTSANDAPLLPVTTVSVDSTIACVAVIDEDSEFISNNQGIDQETMWARFREEYPTRPFCLLMPPHASDIVDIPENFKSDPNIKYHYDISKDPSKSDDWFELCELSKYASVGSIALFIDDSGSMHEKDVMGSYHRFRERLGTSGTNLIKVAVDNEVWIEPFLTTLSAGPPCITKTGATGRCLDKCEERGGIPVAWASGDPEPNCRDFSYQSGVVCCTFGGPPCLGSSGQFTLHLETKDLEHAESGMDPLFRVFSTFGDGHLDFRLSTLGKSLPQRADGEDYIISTGGIPCIDTMLEIKATGTDGWMIGGASIDSIALQSDIWLDGKTFDSSYQGYDYHDRWLLTTLFQKGSYNQIPPTKLDW